MEATIDNVAVIGVAAYSNRDEIYGTLLSARKHKVFLTIYDYKEQWKGFYHHKIAAMKDRLQLLEQQGKEYVIVIDMNDVFIIDDFQVIVDKFNHVYDPKTVLFASDVKDSLWPYSPDWLRAIHKKAFPDQILRYLSGGLIASSIKNYYTLLTKAQQIREDIKSKSPKLKMSQLILNAKPHQTLDQFINDDQFLYNIVRFYNPFFAVVDDKKKLFSTIHLSGGERYDVYNKTSDYGKKIEDGTYIGDASFIHGPGGRCDGLVFGVDVGIVEVPTHPLPKFKLTQCRYRQIIPELIPTCKGCAIRCTNPAQTSNQNIEVNYSEKEQCWLLYDKYCTKCPNYVALIPN
jgi:hypothetical protein